MKRDAWASHPKLAKLANLDEATRWKQFEFLKANLPPDLSEQDRADRLRAIAKALGLT